ncbi:MAG: trigger factor [Deltaproteobacteria bacterium HGW-Deltaproteobacteria-12]|nr:MAG: trigger factor [Deltaproteobacteria bacterium HGW-Deltaproteobacteria-12]
MSSVAIKMEELSAVKKKLSFGIPWSEVKEELDSVYRDIGKKAKLKGFRPGKIPRKVIELYFKEQAESDTITNIINKYYWQELEDKGITAISKPEITQEELKENVDFSFTASFETEPQFEPKGYKGIEVEKETILITDKDLEHRLTEIRQMYATMEEVKEERPVINGDFVTIDFAGSLNGESPNELKAENYFLELGSQRFIPGFEEQIVGMKSGEKKSINVTFPEDYQEKKFAGKEVSFAIEIKNIKEKKLPEVDESFIKNFDRYNSLEDLKKDVLKSLEEEGKKLAESNLQENIMQILLKENDIEVPPTLVERQIYYMMADTHKRMTSAGMDEKNAAELSFKMHDKFKEEATKIVKSFLILKTIAQKESFTVEESEIDKHIADLAEKHGRDYQLLKSAYEKEDRRDGLKAELVQKKVFDFIEQHANIKPVEKTGMNPEVK